MAKMKKGRLIIIWILLILIVSILLIFLKPQERINNIVQAIAILTLVFVTWFYAKQTQALVEQEKKALEEERGKRYIDFGEKRIAEFYKPFINKLNEMVHLVIKEPIDLERIEKLGYETDDLFMKKGYLSSGKMGMELHKFQKILFEAEFAKTRKSIKKFINAQDEIKEILRNEWFEIEDKIRKFYGY